MTDSYDHGIKLTVRTSHQVTDNESLKSKDLYEPNYLIHANRLTRNISVDTYLPCSVCGKDKHLNEYKNGYASASRVCSSCIDKDKRTSTDPVWLEHRVEPIHKFRGVSRISTGEWKAVKKGFVIGVFPTFEEAVHAVVKAEGIKYPGITKTDDGDYRIVIRYMGEKIETSRKKTLKEAIQYQRSVVKQYRKVFGYE